MNTVIASCSRCGYPIATALNETVKFCPYCNERTVVRARIGTLGLTKTPFGLALLGVAILSIGVAVMRRH